MPDDRVVIPKSLGVNAAALVGKCRRENISLVTAEYFTGGLVSSSISAVSGAAQVFEYGFVVQTERALKTLLSVPEMVIFRQGIVSAPVARAMAEGAAHHGAEYGSIDRRTLALTITGQYGTQAGQTMITGRAHTALALRAHSSAADMRHADHSFTADDPLKIRLQMADATLKFAVEVLDELAPSGMGLAT